MNSFIVLAATLCVFFANTNAFQLPSRSIVKRSNDVSMSVFDKAVGDWAKDYPQVL